MKLLVGALMGAAFIFPAHAQLDASLSGTGQLSSDPSVAAQQLQQQAQFTFENQMADLNNQANTAKEGLISRRNQLNSQLQQCYIGKNQNDMEANQQADQATAAATQGLVQGAMTGVAPLVQNMGTANGMGKDEAKSQIREAVDTQNSQVDALRNTCGATASPPINYESLKLSQNGTNSSVLSRVRALSASASQYQTPPACGQSIPGLFSITSSSIKEIEQAKKVDSAATSNLVNVGLAAAALGVQYYGYDSAKKGAAAGLASAKDANQMNYDACQQGVKDEAAELDRQLANVDRQLASDRERLAGQFAQYKVSLPANIQNKNPLTVDVNDALPVLGSLGGTVAATNLNKKNPVFNIPKGGSGSGAAGGGAAGGGGLSADAGGTPGWGFGNPNEPTNSGNLYTLPTQPNAAALVGGSGDSGAMGGGNDPYGQGFMGFEDPFANTQGAAAALATDEATGTNGYWELANRTRRLIYARLGDLLGKPAAPRVGKSDKTDPDRKISSTRN